MKRRKTRKAVVYTGVLVDMDDNSRTVDPPKFTEWIKNNGLTYAEVGREIGFTSGSAITHALKAGVFSGIIVKGLSRCYGINPEDYEYIQPAAEPEETVEQEGTLEVPLEESTLYVTMKTAILDALKEWWGGV